ncbi:hypothetical protein RISK_002259 [Rhodopirellula islandica]|uniref:Uncharacterized protein n=1 Tax=Rhodopirellula islandica TaxID=595434 RepID=A0A0J1BGF6_RHOIS|nr:hypothetical protein RISK_002259 [Rhodopirellula islandica]
MLGRLTSVSPCRVGVDTQQMSPHRHRALGISGTFMLTGIEPSLSQTGE